MIVLLAFLVAAPVVIKSRPSGLKPALAAFSDLPRNSVTVRIGGDVRHPGVYTVSANILTVTAIDLAEPVASLASLHSSVIARQTLQNGDDIRVILNRDGTSSFHFGSMPAAQRLVLGVPLDINSMSAEDFDRIPGIGPALAKRIVAYRQLNGGRLRPEELLSIDGIGEKKYKQIIKFL